jgi:hypothetical protein
MYAAVELMKRYRDIPMDFADATLVCLADELSETSILTLDAAGSGRNVHLARSPSTFCCVEFLLFLTRATDIKRTLVLR